MAMVCRSTIGGHGTFIAVGIFASDPQRYRFQASATPEAIAWARTFAWSLAAALGADQEIAADLRLVVSDLVSEVVLTNPGSELTIAGRTAGNHLILEISPWIDSEPEGRTIAAWDIASSLFDVRRSPESVLVHVDVLGS